jgi:hypothetical protein
MREIPANVKLLLDIEARQDEVLRELEALDERIERVLADCAAFCQPRDGQALPLTANRPTADGRPAIAGGPTPTAIPAPHSLPAVKVA